MHFDAIFRRNAASSPPFASRASCLTMSQRATLFINSKPRFGLAGGSQGPLSGADAPCPARQRGLSWEKAARRKLERSLDNRGDGTCASRVRDAERSDALDGVRHQFSRAGPDLGLRHAQLSVVRSRAVLDRLGVRRGGWCGARDAARGVPGFAGAAAVCRHRADPGDLPGRDGHPEILRPAGVVARHRADHRAWLCRPVRSSCSSTTACRRG